jgi:Methyltransferase domain
MSITSTIRSIGRGLRHPIRATRFLRRLAERPGHLSAFAPVTLPRAAGWRLRRTPPAPVTDTPFPIVDLDTIGDPIPAILDTPEFQRAVAILAEAPTAKRSLLSAATQALAYALIRNARPAHVFEIGTYHGGTTEILARALLANGSGALHTVGPFDEATFTPVFATWQPDLQRILRFYPSDSMAFYMGIEAQDIRAGLVLVDGNHDYEYAAFDIFSAARQLTPGGFIIVDNIAQAGPFLAVRDFLAQYPGWIDCGLNAVDWDRGKSFDTGRCRIPNTDAAILRAPTHRLITDRPSTSGQQSYRSAQITGLTLVLAERPTSGQLFVQCVLRGFARDRIVELVTEASVDVRAGADLKNHLTIVFDKPATVETGLLHYTAESWLIWTGSEPLRLVASPTIL